jgi:hypothetical protein
MDSTDSILDGIPREILQIIVSTTGPRGVYNLARTSRSWWSRHSKLLAATGVTAIRGFNYFIECQTVSQNIENGTRYHGVIQTGAHTWRLYAFGELVEAFLETTLFNRSHTVYQYRTVLDTASSSETYMVKYQITSNGEIAPMSTVQWFHRRSTDWILLRAYTHLRSGQLKPTWGGGDPIVEANQLAYISQMVHKPLRLATLYLQKILGH